MIAIVVGLENCYCCLKLKGSSLYYDHKRLVEDMNLRNMQLVRLNRFKVRDRERNYIYVYPCADFFTNFTLILHLIFI